MQCAPRDLCEWTQGREDFSADVDAFGGLGIRPVSDMLDGSDGPPRGYASAVSRFAGSSSLGGGGSRGRGYAETMADRWGCEDSLYDRW